MQQDGAFGPYRIEAELSRGGQGVVYRARHARLGTPVAVKVLLDGDPVARARFVQEAQVLARLTHPHLPRVTDLGEVDGRPYFAMELIEGEDLERRVLRDGPPAWDWTARVLVAVAEALERCHAAGVVHRDVKPANVVLEEPSGRPVLVDFGLLKRQGPVSQGRVATERLSVTGELRGTPQFMSPEQADGGGAEVGPASDVYALGATLHFLLTGLPPFEAPTRLGLLKAVLEAPPPDPRTTNPEVPEALARVCRDALHKDPAARPPSARAFAARLEEAVTGAGGSASARAPLLLAAALLLLGTGGAGAVMLLRAPAPAPALATSSPPAPPAPGPPTSPAQSPGEDLPTLVARGDRLAREGDPKGAIEAFDRALALDPAARHAWINRGNARRASGDPQGAILDYERALELKPDDVKAIHNRGLARADLGELGAAIADHTRALELAPDFVLALIGRSDAHRARGDLRRARDDLDRALELEPSSAATWNARGNLRLLGGDEPGARADYERAIELQPDLAPALANRGALLLRRGDKEGALADFERAVAADPRYPEARCNRGFLRCIRGDLRGALADADLAVELAPRLMNARVVRGQARAGLGDDRGALEDLELALATQPDASWAPVARELLDQVKARLGK